MDAIAGGGGLILGAGVVRGFSGRSAVPVARHQQDVLHRRNAGRDAALRLVGTHPVEEDPPAAAWAGLGAFAGAKTVTLLDPVRPAARYRGSPRSGCPSHPAAAQFRRASRPRRAASLRALALPALAATIGFYDGFFGPGAGSFILFGLVRWFGYDFLGAAAAAKVLNLSTNFGALVLFAATGNVMFLVALPMAACSIVGALIGAQLAITKGAPFIRAAFLLVVLLLISKLAGTCCNSLIMFHVKQLRHVSRGNMRNPPMSR